MKRRIRSIFILMTLCILGINLFQGYWLYNSYQLQSGQFSRTAMDALLLTLQEQQEAEARALFGEEMEGRGEVRMAYRRFSIGDSAKQRVLVLRNDRLRVHTPDSGTGNSPADVITLRHFSGELPEFELLPVDTLARRLSSRVITSWIANQPFDLARLDSLYRHELKLRGIITDFRLDTLRPQGFKAGMPLFTEGAGGDYPLRMHALPVNPVRNLFVLASFRRPVPYLLQKISWVLAGSLLLGVLTTGCFLYMLATILRQKKLSEIKSDFINNMTHELKTPLATVSAAVEAMQSFGVLNDAAKTQLYLGLSRSQLQRLSDLVDQVLQMAVEEKKELALHREPVDAAELIREIVTQHQVKASGPVTFRLCLPEAGQWVQVDRMHTGNAINNLVDNAIKYSPEGAEIHISSRVEGPYWRLAVKDNGIGIAGTYQKAIFDRFFRVPTGDLHPVKGFGLGLSYVKAVAEKHGGRVEVVSESGQGSEFVLWLPAS